MRKFGLIVLIVLLVILAALLILPNMGKSSASDEGGSSITSLISRYVTGPSDDDLCDFCGAPSTMKKRGYEVCADCYDQAVSYYKSNY